jgi:hypothetical protein
MDPGLADRRNAKHSDISLYAKCKQLSSGDWSKILWMTLTESVSAVLI